MERGILSYSSFRTYKGDSMNKNERAKEELQKGIAIAVNSAIEPYSKQFGTALIISNGTNVGYKIKWNTKQYDNILSLNKLTLSANDTVAIIVPNGQTNNMFILGKLG